MAKQDKINKTLEAIGIKKKGTPVEEEPYRVDISYVLQKIKGMAHPQFIQRGRLQVYYSLKDLVDLFEQDEDFMALVEKDVMKK